MIEYEFTMYKGDLLQVGESVHFKHESYYPCNKCRYFTLKEEVKGPIKVKIIDGNVIHGAIST